MAADNEKFSKPRLNGTSAHGHRTVQNRKSTSDSKNNAEDMNRAHYIYLKYVPYEQLQPKNNITATPTQHNSDYLLLSNSLRSSICSGYPVVRGSHSRIVHNAQIFQDHFESIKLDEQRRSRSFRRKKDWLGRWTEANIVRDRLMKEMVSAQKKTGAANEST